MDSQRTYPTQSLQNPSTPNLLGEDPLREKLRVKEMALTIARSLAQEPKTFQVGVVQELELLFLNPYPEVTR
jgi:hypothetical protein